MLLFPSVSFFISSRLLAHFRIDRIWKKKNNMDLAGLPSIYSDALWRGW